VEVSERLYKPPLNIITGPKGRERRKEKRKRSSEMQLDDLVPWGRVIS